MPLFDAYVMVDWSGSNRRRAGRAGLHLDCTWAFYSQREPTTVSPPSRTEAEHFMRAQLQPIVAAKRGRVFSVPTSDIATPPGSHRCWRSRVSDAAASLAHRLAVSEQAMSRMTSGRSQGQQPTNRSNRFEVASVINAAVSNLSLPGPFWCQFKPGVYAYIPQKQTPTALRSTRTGAISPLRITDRRAKSETPVPSLRQWQCRQPSAHRHPAPSKHSFRFQIRQLLRRLAFRNRMGAQEWKMARSGDSNSACRNLSECSHAS